MNPLPETTWFLTKNTWKGDVAEMIGSEFEFEIDPETISDIQFFDDFDTHLWRAGYLLCQVGTQSFQLINGSGCVEEARASENARFWWQFSDSEVKDELQKLIGLRAVLPFASLKLAESHFFLRNSDQKIVVKGRLSQSISDDHRSRYLTLQAMRGYDKCFSRAEKLLGSLFEREAHEFGLKMMLSELNFPAAGQHQNQALQLSEDMPAELAVRAMANEILDQAIKQVGGVVADTDTEFLHQFRVNMRKLRALISLLKKTLPTSTMETVAPKLSSIAGKTNRLRDLDVFLLARDSFRAMLPANYEKGLNELYALIDKQRRQEKSRVLHYFSSNDYLQDIAVCEAELSSDPAFQTPMAEKPILPVAKSLLVKRYHKILALSSLVNAGSANEDVHQIRIEFKKLRYLMEFFIELLPKKRTARLLAELKKIQSVLGDFNDYCVQVEFLSNYIDDGRIEMSKTLSGLIAILYHKQSETRAQVDEALANFLQKT